MYKPSVNQFDTFSSGSPPGLLPGKNIPHVSLTLVGAPANKPIAQARSPQNHGKYFREATEVAVEGSRARSNSKKKRHIDLRGAVAQVKQMEAVK